MRTQHHRGRTALVHAVPRGENPSEAGEFDQGPVPVVAACRAVDQVGAAHEPRDERARRPLVDVLRGAHLLDPALVHDGDAVGHGQRFLLVVGDEDGGDARLALDPADLVAHRGAQLCVQVRQRFVEEEHGRFHDERAGERDALLLSAGELGDPAAGEVAEPYQAQRVVHPALDVRLGDLPHLQPERDVAGHVQVREERVRLEDHPHVAAVRRCVRDVPAVDPYASRRGRDQAGDHAQRGRLAAARGAEDGEHPAAFHGEVDAAYGGAVLAGVHLGQSVEHQVAGAAVAGRRAVHRRVVLRRVVLRCVTYRRVSHR